MAERNKRRRRPGPNDERVPASPREGPTMNAAAMPQMNMGSQNAPYVPQMSPLQRTQGLILMEGLGEVALEAAILAFAGSVGAFTFEALVSSSEKLLEFIAGMAFGGGPTEEQKAAAKNAELSDGQRKALEMVKQQIKAAKTQMSFMNAGAPQGMPVFANMGAPMMNMPQPQAQPASRDRYGDEYDDDDDYEDERPRRRSRRRRDDDDDEMDDDFENMSDRQYRRALEKRQRKVEKRTEAIGAKLSTLIIVSLCLSPILGCVMNTWGPSLLNWTWEKCEYVLRIPGISYVYELEEEEKQAEEARKKSVEQQAADVEALIKAREAGDTAAEARIMVEMQGTSIDAYYASKEYAAKKKEKADIEERFGRKSAEDESPEVKAPAKDDSNTSSETEPAPKKEAASDPPKEPEVKESENDG